MGVIKNCLTMIGLMCVLLVGSCVAGMRGCSRVVDPTVFNERVKEEPVKARRMVAAFLETATYEPESALKVDGKPAKVAVQDFTDGSIHMTLDRGERRLVEVVVQVKPDGEYRSRIEVISDATQLADAQGGHPAVLHRRIRSDLSRAFEAIDSGRPVPGGFSMARLIRAGEDDA